MATRSDLVPSTSIASASFDRSGRHLTVYLSGELDAASTPLIRVAIGEHRRPDDEQLWIDMSALTFCDSSGLVLLFELQREASEVDTLFTLYAPTTPVRRVIEMCDPSHVLSIRT